MNYPDNNGDSARAVMTAGPAAVISWREAGLVLLLWGLFVALLYANTLHSPFIFDDSRIYNNSHIQIKDLSPASLIKAAVQSEQVRPVSNLSFALNYSFHQFRVTGYHVVNIVIHIMTGLLLFFLVKATVLLAGGKVRADSFLIAFFSALLWLVHPLQTQSITYIVQRMNSMAAMFYLLAFLCYILARLSGKGRRAWLLFGACLFASLLALGSKEIAATLPPFILLYEWFFFQDMRRSWLREHVIILPATAAFLVAAALVFTAGHPVQEILASYSARSFTLAERLLTETRVVFFYLGLLLIPHPARLNLDHDFVVSASLLEPPTTLVSLLLLAALFLAACRLAGRERLIAFCIFWFLGQLVIESSCIGLEIIFEHRLYLPSMFAAVLFVIAVRRLAGRAWLWTGLLSILVLIFSLWTYERNRVWADEITLWSDCVLKSPQKARPHNNLGYHLKQKGRIDEALLHFQAVVRIDPDFTEAYNNIGNIMAARGQFDEALRNYYKAISLAPDNPVLHNNIGNALVEKWRLEDALLHYSEAVRLKPDFTEARLNLESLRRMIRARELRKGTRP